MMHVREHETPEGLVVAVCDTDVLGETFSEGSVSLTVTEEFYGGTEADETGVINALQRAVTANIVGDRAVALAIDHGLIDETAVLEVDGTRHAQFVRL